MKKKETLSDRLFNELVWFGGFQMRRSELFELSKALGNLPHPISGPIRYNTADWHAFNPYLILVASDDQWEESLRKAIVSDWMKKIIENPSEWDIVDGWFAEKKEEV